MSVAMFSSMTLICWMRVLFRIVLTVSAVPKIVAVMTKAMM